MTITEEHELKIARSEAERLAAERDEARALARKLWLLITGMTWDEEELRSQLPAAPPDWLKDANADR